MKKLMIGAAAAVVAAGAYAEVLNWTFNGKTVVPTQKAGTTWNKQGTVKTYALSVDGETIWWTGSGKNASQIEGYYPSYLNVIVANLNNGDLNVQVSLLDNTAKGFGKLDKDGALKSASGSYVDPTFFEYGTWSVKKNASVENKLANGVALDKAYKFPAGIAGDIAGWQESWGDDFQKRAEEMTSFDDVIAVAGDLLVKAYAHTNDMQTVYDEALAVKAAYYADMTNTLNQYEADMATVTKLVDAYTPYAVSVGEADGLVTSASNAWVDAVAAQTYWETNKSNIVAFELNGDLSLWTTSNEFYKAAVTAAKAEWDAKGENLKDVIAEQQTAYDAFYAQVNLMANKATSDQPDMWKAVADKDGNVTNYFDGITTTFFDSNADQQLKDYYSNQARDAFVKALNCEVKFEYGYASNETNEIDYASEDEFQFLDTLLARDEFIASFDPTANMVTEGDQHLYSNYYSGDDGWRYNNLFEFNFSVANQANGVFVTDYRSAYFIVKAGDVTIARGDVQYANQLVYQITDLISWAETYKKTVTDPEKIEDLVENAKWEIQYLAENLK